MKFVFEDGVFRDMFRDNIGGSSIQGFGADTPRNRGVVAKKFDIVFSRIIMYSGFDSGRGELGGGVAVQPRSSILRLSFAMLKWVYSPVTISVYLSRALFQ